MNKTCLWCGKGGFLGIITEVGPPLISGEFCSVDCSENYLRMHPMQVFPPPKGYGNHGWHYCKYCYRNVRVLLNYDGSLLVCRRCHYGLVPLYMRDSHPTEEAWKKWKANFLKTHPKEMHGLLEVFR